MLRTLRFSLDRYRVVAEFLDEQRSQKQRPQATLASKRRVLELVEECQALQMRLAEVTDARRPSGAGPQGDLQLQRLLGRLNERLRRYQSVPFVEVAFFAQHDSTYPLLVRLAARPSHGTYDKRRKSEANIVQLILEMVGLGLFDRLVRCDCGRWFVALRKDGKWCSLQCRQRKHRNNAGYKEARRAYMRHYRLLLKSTNVK